MPSVKFYFTYNNTLPRGLMVRDKNNHRYIIPENYNKRDKKIILFDVANNEDVEITQRDLSKYRVVKQLPSEITTQALSSR